jgi:hypothetical protein
MFKFKWKVLEQWVIENKHRIIFKPQSGECFLIEITMDCNNIYEITNKVENELWTKEELMQYLNQRSQLSQHKLGR